MVVRLLVELTLGDRQLPPGSLAELDENEAWELVEDGAARPVAPWEAARLGAETR